MPASGIRPFSRVAFILACSFLPGQSALAEVLNIPGSGNSEFVLGELAKAFNARQTEHRVLVPSSSGHAGAIRDVSEGVAAMGRVGRPPSHEERASGLYYLPLGRDAVVAVAGAAVTAKGLSSDQLAAVFAGKISNWRDLGGQPAPIRAIGKESSDAIRRQLPNRYKDLVYADSVKIVHLDPHLIDLLDRYPTSFSIVNRSALAACKTKVVMLTLDGIEPSYENLISGRYPLTMEFGLVYRTGEISPAGKAFVEFVRSPEGAGILRKYGVLVNGGGKQ